MFRVDAEAERVGQVACTAGVALTQLRPADGAGLEEMFLILTSDTQRGPHPAATSQGAVA